MKTYYIFTLGCQMNISDSERIASVLNQCGLKSSPESEADLIIINACSVRQKPVDRIFGKIKLWQKKKNPPKIYLTGCVLSDDLVKLKSKVDEYFEIKDLNKLPKLLHQNQKLPRSYLKIQPAINKSRLAYVPIMTGCDNFCTYCAVPYTRGREISRSEKEIICEFKSLIKRGYRKIILLGQNVNSYAIKLKNKNSKIKTTTQNLKLPFSRLLEKIDRLPGGFQFNFLTSHPKDITPDLIKTLSKLKKWEHILHLPVQSGDDGILKKMNRGYTAKQYLNLISNLKSQISNLEITTDIIVGFPGESKKAFLNTVKLCKKAKFAKAYIAMYSPRPGTAAAKLKDNVSITVKKRRWQILNKLINIK